MAPGSRTSLIGVQPMPIIPEDGDGQPQQHQAAAGPPNRPGHNRSRSYAGSIASNGSADRSSYPRYPPPAYSVKDLPDRTPLEYKQGLQEKGWFARRGGWYRLALIAFIFTALAVGLAVGLTIGLGRQNSSSDSSYPPTGPPPGSSSPGFPVGSWSFTAALASMTTSCTSNPAAWRCAPDVLFSNAGARSLVTFFWTIAASPSSPITTTANPTGDYGLVVSSTRNPFSPQFSNLTLRRGGGNGGSDDETLQFEFDIDQNELAAAPQLDGQGNRAATCLFRNTTVRATLWLRRRGDAPFALDRDNRTAMAVSPSSPSNSSSSGSGSAGGESPPPTGDFPPWPYAFEFVQTQPAMPGSPACVDWHGSPVGTFEARDPRGQCGCEYRNFAVGVAGGGGVAGTNGTTPTGKR